MSITLRDYQQKAVENIKKFFKKGGLHLLLQSPTGSGKTVMFSYIAENSAKRNKRVLILTDRAELLKQTGSTLTEFGLDPYFIRAGSKFINYKKTVYVAMALTLRNRINNDIWRRWILNNIDLIIIDEAHIQTMNYIFESGLLNNKFVIGFTATPKRSGKMRQLALDYEEIIETISVKELINQGYLVNDDYYGVNNVDLTGLKYDKLKGDYSEADMFARFNDVKLYSGVVKNWLEVANNTQTIIFCVNIEHVIHTCEEFHKNGIDARFVVSGMSQPKEPNKDAEQGEWVRYQERMRLYELYLSSFSKWSGERTSLITGFKNKQFPVLINAGILTTGFDEPSIETVIVNRATTSPTLWLQMIGRGSRPHKNKSHFNILDFGGNASRLGHYTSPQLWRLWHEDKNSADGVAPVKLCGEDANGKKRADKNAKMGCERMILASYKICPFCGYIYPDKKAAEVELIGVAYDTERHKAVSVKKVSEMTEDELYDYFKMKRHKSAWLWRQLYFKGGEQAIRSFGLKHSWKNGTIENAINYIKGL